MRYWTHNLPRKFRNLFVTVAVNNTLFYNDWHGCNTNKIHSKQVDSNLGSVMKTKLHTLYSALLFLAICTPLASGQVRQAIDPDYITNDTFLILVLHPQKVISQVGKDNETVQFIQEQLNNNTSIELSKMTRFTLLLGGSNEVDDPSGLVAVVMRFTDDVDAGSFADSMFGFADYTDGELEGVKIKKPGGEISMPCFWNPDGKTIVMAEERRLASVIKNAAGMPNGTDLSRKISANCDLAFAVDLTNLSETKKEMLGDLTEMWAPQGLNAEEMSKLASSCLMSIQTSDNIPAQFEFQAKDADSMAELKTKVEGMWKQAIEQMDNLQAEFKENMPEAMQATAKAMTDTFKILKSDANVVSSGETVSIQIERMQGFKEAAVLIVEGFAAPFRMIPGF